MTDNHMLNGELTEGDTFSCPNCGDMLDPSEWIILDTYCWDCVPRVKVEEFMQ